MKLLVTGANGFVGSYFINNSKYDIHTFSFMNDNFEELDLTGIDAIVHLTALVHQMNGASDQEYRKVNVQQTVDLAKKAKRSGVKHFIFMSTVKVYGEESKEVYTEYSQCHPSDAYGKSKLEAEMQLHSLEEKDFRVSIIRTPIVYGKGVKANFLSLIHLVKKIPFLPFGGIENRRSIVYIGNLSAIIDRVIQTRESGIFLAADDHTVSTSRLIRMISSALHQKIFLFSLPFSPILLKVFRPMLYRRLYENLEVDNSQTKKRLNFQNPYSTEEGIELMIDQGDL